MADQHVVRASGYGQQSAEECSLESELRISEDYLKIQRKKLGAAKQKLIEQKHKIGSLVEELETAKNISKGLEKEVESIGNLSDFLESQIQDLKSSISKKSSASHMANPSANVTKRSLDQPGQGPIDINRTNQTEVG